MRHSRRLRSCYARRQIDCQIHDTLAIAARRSIREPFLALMRIARRRTEMLRARPGCGRAGWTGCDVFLRGLLALANFHRSWLRDPDDWTDDCPQSALLVQFGALARHLLATHEVPHFMTLVWLEPPSGRALTHQRLFRHLGLGYSVRGFNSTQHVSHSIEEHFLRAPDHLTVEQALRWSALRAGGADRKLANQLASPPAPLPVTANGWRPAALGGFRFVEPQSNPHCERSWTIRQLTSDSDLYQEGRELRHCVALYGERAARGEISLWSLQSHGSLTSRRVLTIEVNSALRAIVTALGWCNSRPREDARQVMGMWARQERLRILTETRP